MIIRIALYALLSILFIVLYIFGFLSAVSAILIGVTVGFILHMRIADCDVILSVLEKVGKCPKKALKGKVVWITGASSGIGKAIALKLAKCGCRLAISARSKDKLIELRQQCISNENMEQNDILVVDFDILNQDLHKDSFEKVIKFFGKLDILVSNAGCLQQGCWEQIDLSVDKSIFELNVFSLVSLARIVTAYFLNEGNGHHVVTSSISGRMPYPLSASYCGSKYAIQGYFETLRCEYASRKIGVTMLDIGPCDTNIFDASVDATGEAGSGKAWQNLMSTDRCADLAAVAVAHRLPEVYISSQPALFLLYGNVYITSLVQWSCLFINYTEVTRKMMK